jgi:hypothetical protein
VRGLGGRMRGLVGVCED